MLAAELGLPVVFMSGYTGELVERHGMLPGTRLVQKPFSAVELRRQVRATLDDGAALDGGQGRPNDVPATDSATPVDAAGIGSR